MSSQKTSGGRRRRSSKRSGAKRKPPDPILFTDECLGRFVPAALTAAGCDVRPCHDHFPGRLDVEWLPEVGARGWVVITKDKNIRRNILEVQTIINARVKAFVLTGNELRKEDQAELLVRLMKKIRRVCMQRGPFIYTVSRLGYMSRMSTRTLMRRAR